MPHSPLMLGVNIDHVATLRQARGGESPDVLASAKEAVQGGADSITVHLREDRRHIQDQDVLSLLRSSKVPINLEMALVPEMIQFALRKTPPRICLVPEKRQELTTEGGLDVLRKRTLLYQVMPKFLKQKMEVSLFVDPVAEQILTAWGVGAQAIEIHTGTYANAKGKKKQQELKRIQEAAVLASRLNLKVHAGHGLDYLNVQPIARIPEICELNIGHSIVSRSIFVGMRQAVREMKKLL